MKRVHSERRIELNNQLGEYVYVVTAKTSAERQAGLKARRTAAGLVSLKNVWVHPEDVPAMREHASKLARRRENRSSINKRNSP